MLSPDRATDLSPLRTAAVDYDIVRRAIGHIRGHWREQPSVEEIAEAAGVTATELHHLFRRWCGLSPKAFLQALTLHQARRLLRESASVLDTAYEVGLSCMTCSSPMKPCRRASGRRAVPASRSLTASTPPPSAWRW
jgi:AraC family transcriptional regulator of adaptative response/methylated-DNA-[protein]-cysteine methyltransferase